MRPCEGAAYGCVSHSTFLCCTVLHITVCTVMFWGAVELERMLFLAALLEVSETL